MSKYQPLSDRLRGHPADEWRTSFSELEDVLGFPLPKGARSGRAWWMNDQAKPHSRAWAAHGWQAHEVDPSGGVVTFRRGDISPVAVEAVAGLAPVGDLSSVKPPEFAPAASPPSAQLSSGAQPSADEPAAPKPKRGAGGKAAAPLTVQAPASTEVQPQKDAAEEASKKRHATRMVGMTALVAGAAAVVAGIGAVVVRGLMRRRT
jgi:hypothetical protein